MDSTAILDVRNVSKAFGGIRAVNDLSLKLQMHRITALIGPNGAGKTTLFNLIGGFLPWDSGDIHFRGTSIRDLEPYQVGNLGIIRLFQDVRLFEKMTALENLLVAARRQSGERLPILLTRPGRVRREDRENRERALRWLDHVGLRSLAFDLAGNLSYGQQKLVALTRCLAADPDLLLLDEPVSGLDPVHRGQLLELIREFVGRDRSVCIIEHNMDTVVELADWALLLLQGQVAAEGPPAVLMADRRLQDLYFGITDDTA